MLEDFKDQIFDLYINKRKRPTYISNKLSLDIKILRDYLKQSGLSTIRRKNGRDLAKKTCLEKYGVEYAAQSKIVKNKILNTCLEKYGTKSPLESDIVKEKSRKTLIEKYGVENCMMNKEIRQKAMNTMVEKYGASTTMQSKELKEKVLKTNLEKYGGQPCHSKEVINKMKETNLEKYGTECSLNNSKIKEKMFRNNLEKYNCKWHISSDIVKEKIMKARKEHFGEQYNNIEKLKQTNLKRYGVPFYVMTKICREKSGITISKINLKFSEFLSKSNLDNELEFKINTYSYDIHILNSNILIEIDPFAYHNQTWHPFNKPKDRYYHYNKTKLSLENNYICIHKFDWMTNEEILKIIENIQDYHIIQKEPILHWYNSKTKEHLLDNNFDRDDMINKGFVEIYDDGIAFI